MPKKHTQRRKARRRNNGAKKKQQGNLTSKDSLSIDDPSKDVPSKEELSSSDEIPSSEYFPIEIYMMGRDPRFCAWLMDQVEILRSVFKIHLNPGQIYQYNSTQVECDENNITIDNYINETNYDNIHLFYLLDGTAILISRGSTTFHHFRFEQCSDEMFNQILCENNKFNQDLNKKKQSNLSASAPIFVPSLH